MGRTHDRKDVSRPLGAVGGRDYPGWSRTRLHQPRVDWLALICTLLVYTLSETIVKHVGIKQARQELPDLIDRAEAGEEIVITRQGKAVAKLVAAPKTLKPLPSLAEFRHGIGRPRTPAVQLLREERNAR